jgi:hypothetical protein
MLAFTRGNGAIEPYIKAVKMRICVTNMTDFHGFLLENPYNRILFGAAPEDLFTGCLA